MARGLATLAIVGLTLSLPLIGQAEGQYLQDFFHDFGNLL